MNSQKCRICGKNRLGNQLEQESYWKSVQKVYEDLGFKTSDDLKKQLKEKVSGLCDLCGEKTLLELAFGTLVIQEVEDKKTQDRFFIAADLLKSISAEIMWMDVKDLILKEITESKLGGKNVWRLFMEVVNMNSGQTRHVEAPERNFIQELSKRRYSIREIAFIFKRSTETIHKIVSDIPPSSRVR